jgi:hypothetical protein
LFAFLYNFKFIVKEGGKMSELSSLTRDEKTNNFFQKILGGAKTPPSKGPVHAVPAPLWFRGQFHQKPTSPQASLSQSIQPNKGVKMATNSNSKTKIPIFPLIVLAVGLFAIYMFTAYLSAKTQAYNNTDAGKMELLIDYCKAVKCDPRTTPLPQGFGNVPAALSQTAPAQVTPPQVSVPTERAVVALGHSEGTTFALNKQYVVSSGMTTHLFVPPSRRGVSLSTQGPALFQSNGKQYWTEEWDAKQPPNTLQEVFASKGLITLTAGGKQFTFQAKE